MTAFVIIFEGPFFYQSSTRIFEPFWDSIYRFFSDRFFFEIPEILSTSGWLYIYTVYDVYIYIYLGKFDHDLTATEPWNHG